MLKNRTLSCWLGKLKRYLLAVARILAIFRHHTLESAISYESFKQSPVPSQMPSP
jgi:hypothetical protein